MASFMSSAGSKRVRPWDSCQDIEKLKEMLEERQTEIESLKKLVQSPAINEGDTAKELQQSFQMKDGRIQELPLREATKKSNAVSAFGKLFAASSKPLPDNVFIDDPKKRTRLATSQKPRLAASDSGADTDGGEGLASDSTDDEDFTLEKKAADDHDDDNDDDDEEDIVALVKRTDMRRQITSKSSTHGVQRADGAKTSQANVANLRASIQKQIVGQMVYRQGLKYRTSKAVAEVPNLSESDMRAILGDDLFAKASRKGKLIQVKASENDIDTLFKDSINKRLRYGAMLGLCDGLKFVFTKATGVLKVTGVYKMY